MKNLIETINNYIHEENQYALQIDGEWGTGKTYFIKNTIIKKLCENADYHPLYFSVYGYNNLLELKQDLFNKILSEISKNQKILSSINSISKRFSKLSKSLGYTKFSSIGLISDWIVEISSNAGMKKSNHRTFNNFYRWFRENKPKYRFKRLIRFHFKWTFGKIKMQSNNSIK